MEAPLPPAFDDDDDFDVEDDEPTNSNPLGKKTDGLGFTYLGPFPNGNGAVDRNGAVIAGSADSCVDNDKMKSISELSSARFLSEFRKIATPSEKMLLLRAVRCL